MSTLSPFARLPNLDVASQVVFVQIGANDGKRLTGMPCGDPIYALAKSHNWTGFALEPNPRSKIALLFI